MTQETHWEHLNRHPIATFSLLMPFDPTPTVTEFPAGDSPFSPPVVVGLQVAIDREMAYRFEVEAKPWQSAASKGKGTV